MENQENYNNYSLLPSEDKDTEVSRSYEIEDLMEMLGGDKYYSMDNIMYVYHSLKNEHDEAAYYMYNLIQKEKALERKLNKIKTISSQGNKIKKELDCRLPQLDCLEHQLDNSV
jgi:hypothetical protein